MPARKAKPKPPDADPTKWTDSRGIVHDLLAEKLHALKEAAPMFGAGRSVLWLRRQIKAGKVAPVFRSSRKALEVFECAIVDWHCRQMVAQAGRTRR